MRLSLALVEKVTGITNSIFGIKMIVYSTKVDLMITTNKGPQATDLVAQSKQGQQRGQVP